MKSGDTSWSNSRGQRDAGWSELQHTADTGLRVWAPTLPEFLCEAAKGMFDVVVDTTTVRTVLTREVRVSGGDSEQLLVAWLSELNFLHQTLGELYADFEVTLSNGGHVVGRAMGEKLDPVRHRLRTEIKGITYHGLRVTKRDRGWEGTVIFDV